MISFTPEKDLRVVVRNDKKLRQNKERAFELVRFDDLSWWIVTIVTKGIHPHSMYNNKQNYNSTLLSRYWMCLYVNESSGSEMEVVIELRAEQQSSSLIIQRSFKIPVQSDLIGSLAAAYTTDVIIPNLASPSLSVSHRRGWFPSSYCCALSEPLVNSSR